MARSDGIFFVRGSNASRSGLHGLYISLTDGDKEPSCTVANDWRCDGGGYHNYTLEVVDRFAVPGGPDCMDLTADGKWLYATSRWARRLSVVDLEKKQVVHSIPVGRSPHGVWTLDHASRR